MTKKKNLSSSNQQIFESDQLSIKQFNNSFIQNMNEGKECFQLMITFFLKILRHILKNYYYILIIKLFLPLTNR